MYVRYTICYLRSIMIIGAYCVGKVHNMLPQEYHDNWSILRMVGTQYATLVVLFCWKRIV